MSTKRKSKIPVKEGTDHGIIRQHRPLSKTVQKLFRRERMRVMRGREGNLREKFVPLLGLFATLLIFAMFGVLSAAAPVLTIQSPDGDTIDCINKLDQPALKHSLLKNHLIQETPPDMIKSDEEIGWQIWHANGETCPDGTVAIRRFEPGVSHTKQHNYHLVPDAGKRATKGHQYAIGYTYGYPIYGAKATMNVWKPIVESSADFSLAQIWVRSGNYDDNDLNTVEAGWHIYPERYHDNQPRLFTYWTKDAYLSSGCYGGDRDCNAFVHVSNTIALGAAINRTSTVGRDQFDITIQIWKDQVSGDWWLGLGKNPVRIGYWPSEFFTSLVDHAMLVQWGGEVYRPTPNKTTILQMGSGEYADKGFGKAAYFCNIEIAQHNRTFLPIQDFYAEYTHESSYTSMKTYSRGCGNHFYYGGPGPVPLASPGPAPSASVPFIFLFFLVFFL